MLKTGSEANMVVYEGSGTALGTQAGHSEKL